MGKTYQPISGADVAMEVVEYPSFADERAFHRLLVSTSTDIVGEDAKDRICEKWGWDKAEQSEDVEGYIEYHMRVAEIVFQDGERIRNYDRDQIRPGAIQDARVDFIQGCQGRQNEPQNGSTQALEMMASLLAQNGTSKATTGSD